MAPQTLELPIMESPTASPTEDTFVLPCSVSQKRFWLLEQIAPGNTALLIPIALKLSGPLDKNGLEEALNLITERHEILRTHFESIEGEPKQVISPKATLPLGHLDLGELSADLRSKRIVELMSQEAAQSIQVGQAPLLRATLIRVAELEHVLMLTAHHIISDGWSSGVLVRELSGALRKGQSDDLPPLTIQYADYVIWQAEWMQTPGFEQQLSFWKEELSGELPVLDLPTDFPRHSNQSAHAILESLLLPTSLVDALKDLCLEKGVTLFMIFFSAYAFLLHRYSGQQQLMVGTTGANRNKPELENLVGLFANLLIQRVEIKVESTFLDFLLEQRDRLLGSFAHSEVPFEKVLEQLQTREGGVPKTLLQTHFLFQRAFMQPTVCDDLSIQPLYSVSPGSTFELAFGIVERGEGIRLQMEYRTALYKQSTVQQMLHQFQALLESVVNNIESPLNEVSLFPRGERERVEVSGHAPLDQSTFLITEALDQELEKHLREGRETFTPAVTMLEGGTLVTLDAQRRLLPVGISGDVYLQQPPLGVHSSKPASLVATGFVGRNTQGGGVELWGRKEDIFRRSRFRVNLRATEFCFRLHPEIEDAVIVVGPKEGDESTLYGFVVLKPGSNLKEKDLRAFLRGKVSDLLIPSVLTVVPSLPRDAAGRISSEQLLGCLPGSPLSEQRQVPLQGVLHQQLRELWCEILKVRDVSIQDNFFECGGTSFLAMRMMLKAEKLCHRPLPLSLLLTGANIESLARFIATSNAEAEANLSLIPVQTRGTRSPLFFLHGDWVGGGFYCNRLAQQLGEEQPFYALPPPRVLDANVSIQSMAARHLEAIQKQAPQGPYVLGGYCIGALVAAEVAKQLLSAGETVSHLFLIDPPLRADPWLARVWPWVNRWGHLRRWSLEKRISFFDRYAVASNRWLKRAFAPKAEAAPNSLPALDSTGVGLEDEKALEGLDYSLYFLAYRTYRVQPLSVPATIFIPETTPAHRRADTLSVSKMDPEKCVVEIVPGNHTTCVTQSTSLMAEKMQQTLAAS